jgi:hypothetical protein
MEYVFGALSAIFVVLCMIYARLGDVVKELEVTNINLSVLLTEISRIQALQERQHSVQEERSSPPDDLCESRRIAHQE